MSTTSASKTSNTRTQEASNGGFDAQGKRSLSQEQLDSSFNEYIHYVDRQMCCRLPADELLQAALTTFRETVNILNWLRGKGAIV